MGVLHELRDRFTDDLVALETLDRMIERVERGEVTEDQLLIQALFALENQEANQVVEALDLEVKRRRDLPSRIKMELERFVRERRAVEHLKLQSTLKLLKEAPRGRQITVETVNDAFRLAEYRKKHPSWDDRAIATKYWGDPAEAERLRQCLKRTLDALGEDFFDES